MAEAPSVRVRTTVPAELRMSMLTPVAASGGTFTLSSATVAADGAVTSKSPELLVADGVVKIKCYPVTLRAYLAWLPSAGLSSEPDAPLFPRPDLSTGLLSLC